MPPKRDQGKGKGKNKAPVVEEPFNPCDVIKPKASGLKPEEQVDEDTLEVFLLQISDCEEKLKSYQRKADELAVKTQFLPELFEQLDRDKKDLSSYLQCCLQEKEETLKTVKAEYEASKGAKQEQDDDQRKQLEDVRKQLEETKQQMGDQNVAIRTQLVALKPVEEDMTEIYEAIAGLVKELSERDERNVEQTYQQERTATMEVERLRREAEVRIGMVAEECKVLAEKKLKEHVKRCMIESDRAMEKMTAKYSDEAISGLLRQNDNLRRRTDENQRLIEVLETNRVKLDRENKRQNKVMEALVLKVKGHESLDLDFRYQQTDRQIRRPLAFMKGVVDDERKLLVDATERRKTLQKNLETTNGAVKSASVANKELYDSLMAASPGLQEILPTSDAKLLQKLETLASEDALRHLEPSEAPPPTRRRLRLVKRKTAQQNCIAKPT